MEYYLISALQRVCVPDARGSHWEDRLTDVGIIRSTLDGVEPHIILNGSGLHIVCSGHRRYKLSARLDNGFDEEKEDLSGEIIHFPMGQVRSVRDSGEIIPTKGLDREKLLEVMSRTPVGV